MHELEGLGQLFGLLPQLRRVEGYFRDDLGSLIPKLRFEVEGEGSTTIISTNDVDPSVSAIGEPGSPQTEEEPSDEEEVNALEDELQLMKEQEGFQ